MTSKKKREVFGHRLMESVLRTFRDAYLSHKLGASKDEMLIQHDIYAAASDYPEPIIKAHRSAILSAIDAADKGVSLPEAHAYMRKRLMARLGELLNEKDNTT